MIYILYKYFTILFQPFIRLHLQLRIKKGKEDPDRLSERMGVPSVGRPDGFLVWCHAASVGESQSMLSMINRLLQEDKHLKILVTTGTLTSAKMMADQLPKGCIHQFAPVDCHFWVTKFLNHWKPDLAIWLESELWPNMLLQAHKKGVRKVLLNARMSDKSFDRWMTFGGLVRQVLQAFDTVFAQTSDDERKFIQLGAYNTRKIENLKYANPPLKANSSQQKVMQEKLRRRPVWVAASTHAGEEKIIGLAHKRLMKEFPSLVTIIVPRHPSRGDGIRQDLEMMGLPVHQRSQKDTIRKDTQIYLADTLGELGLFYRLSEVVFVGGSLVPIGGHNLIEPAQLLSSIIVGPYMDNFSKMYREFRQGEALITARDEYDLAESISKLLSFPSVRKAMAKAASKQANKHLHVLDDVMRILKPLLYKDQ